jgi:hypothetical protein
VGAKAEVEQVVHVDQTEIDFGDPTVHYSAAEGTGGRDGVMEVRSPGGVTLVFNDLVGNMRHQRGVGGLVFRVLGFTGPTPKLPALSRLFLVRDRRALRSHLERLAATPDLVRIIVSHGDVIAEAPAEALRGVAAHA